VPRGSWMGIDAEVLNGCITSGYDLLIRMAVTGEAIIVVISRSQS
jgi:hypothetical protein